MKTRIEIGDLVGVILCGEKTTTTGRVVAESVCNRTGSRYLEVAVEYEEGHLFGLLPDQFLADPIIKEK